MNDGTTKHYGSPNAERDGKLRLTIDAIASGGESVCGIEAAASHTRCVIAAQESMPQIAEFPRQLIRVTGDPGRRATSVDGLDDVLRRCYAEWRLPSELDDVSWARPGKQVAPQPWPDTNLRNGPDDARLSARMSS
jgi:hypothetical protein